MLHSDDDHTLALLRELEGAGLSMKRIAGLSGLREMTLLAYRKDPTTMRESTRLLVRTRLGELAARSAT